MSLEGFFSLADLAALAPEILLSLAAGLTLLPDLITRRRSAGSGYLALALATAVLGVVVWMWIGAAGSDPVTAFSGSFVADRFSQFFKIVFLIATVLAIGMSVRLLDQDRAQAGEYYALMLLATVGMMFMASGLDLLVIWLGLELMSLSSYVLTGFLKENRKSTEAALKYFLLGAFSSGILLYGISLVYGSAGTTRIPDIARVLAGGVEPGPLFHLGIVLLVAGLGFKVAVVPFHQWAPDVYEGAPTGITAFISTASKAAAFAAMLRIFAAGFLGGDLPGIWVPLLVVLAAASMIFGNVAALLQENVKRMLAYSSIGHAGYIFMGLVAAGGGRGSLRGGAPDAALGTFGVSAVLVYVLVYTFTNIGAFAVVAALRSEERSGERVSDFRGLSRRSPLLAFAMLVFLLSLAGMPATAGFIGKWYLFGAALSADYAWLAVIAVIMTTVSAYYYLRVVVAMYMAGVAEESPITLPPALAATLVVALIFTLLIGVYPARFLSLAAQGAADLQALGPFSWRL